MIGLFKRQPKAEPIFSVLGTDMHCHLLPGVDDGSRTLDDSVSYLKQMENLGFSSIYITPHFNYPRYNNEENDIEKRYAVLQQAAYDAGVKIELKGIAGEYRIDDRFDDRIARNCFLSIANRYVLVELSLHQQRRGTADAIFRVQNQDREVILAHPERYPYLGSHAFLLEQLKEQEVYFQVNILSLAGFYGEMAKRVGYELIEKGWVEFLGTDTHNQMYVNALIRASHDRKIRRLLDKCEFMNCKL